MDDTKTDYDAAYANPKGFTLSDEELNDLSDNGCLEPELEKPDIVQFES